MSLRDRMTKGPSITLSDEDEAQAASMRPSSPTTGPGQTMTIAALRKQIADLKAQLEAHDTRGVESAEKRIRELEEQLATASTLEVPLSDLHEAAGRRRHMPPEKYIELRENLRHNKLIHPVVVLPRSEGGYEIISGHHRSDAYRELGRDTIRCVLGDATAEEADDGAFFANLMQSDLTDYEKYVGLKRFQQQHADLSQTAMSERVGISRTHLNALLSFEKLPRAVHEVLDQHKALIGANAAAELASIAEAGKSQRVIEAVEQLAQKKLDQAQAVKYARASETPQAVKPVAASYKIRAGKTTWCDVRKTKNVMRIEFQTEEIANSVEDAIRQHLENLAAQR